MSTVVFPYPEGDTFKDTQWMAGATFIVFSLTFTLKLKV